MTLTISFRFALFLTVITVTSLWLSSIVWLNAGLTLLLFISWYITYCKSQNDMANHTVLLNRVEQLQQFSLELQALVNQELALVQEDIGRVQSIVEDSVTILQGASLSLSATLLEQTKEFNNLTAYMDIAQQAAVNAPQAVGGDQQLSNLHGLDPQWTKNNIALMKSDVDKTLLALQFEDIVRQISERVVLHVGDIKATVTIFSKLCDSEISSNFDSEMKEMYQEYLEIKEKLQQVSAKKIASQQNMDEGDIDLF